MSADDANAVFTRIHGELHYNHPHHGEKFIMVDVASDKTTFLIFSNQHDIDELIDELLDAKIALGKIKR